MDVDSKKNVLDEMWALYHSAKKDNDINLAFNILAEIHTITPQPEPTTPQQ